MAKIVVRMKAVFRESAELKSPMYSWIDYYSNGRITLKDYERCRRPNNPFLNSLYYRLLLQQDNARPHTACKTQNTLCDFYLFNELEKLLGGIYFESLNDVKTPINAPKEFRLQKCININRHYVIKLYCNFVYSQLVSNIQDFQLFKG